MYKYISYSYPTSTNAVKFGFKDGCYVVCEWNQIEPGKVIEAFATKEEALSFADSLSLPKCPILSKYFYP